MPSLSSSLLLIRRLAVAAALSVGAAGAQAEKADRFKPLNVEADQPGRIDLLNQHVVFNGNVVVTKGTMVIRAARIEVRETPDGYHSAVALGAPGKPATFRQKRDGVDETVEGAAERIDFDGRTDTLRFEGNAAVRRLRSGVVADEITGSLITWDNTNELFKVTGGAATPANPSGRVRAVFAPREEAASAPAAASAASAPPAKATVPLKPSSRLGSPG